MAQSEFPKYQEEALGGLWRSEDMACVNIIASRDVVRETILSIGRLGKAQFIDLNEGMVAFSRPVTQQLRTCEEMIRKLRLLEDELVLEPGLVEARAIDFDMGCSFDEMRQLSTALEIDSMEEKIDEVLANVQAMTSNLHTFRMELNYDHSLSLLYGQLSDSAVISSSASAGVVSRDGSFNSTYSVHGLANLPHLLGTIKSTAAEDLRRMCYRVTRGNAVVIISEEQLFFDPATGEKTVSRCLFTILGSSALMITRLRKLVESLGSTVYDISDVLTRGKELHKGTAVVGGSSPAAGTGIPGKSLLEAVQHLTEQKTSLLTEWYRDHRIFKTFLRVERAVLIHTNLCSFSGQTANISLWIPVKYMSSLRTILESARVSSAGDVPSIMSMRKPQPYPVPTYFETNVFTKSFQSIVNSYGMAHYKEVNPGVFTIITFPYLFGIMYGDMGHGILLLLVSVYLIYKGQHWRKEELNEIVKMIFGGRYLLLFMAIFSIYMGVLYNDFMGFSLNIFPSGYKWGTMVPHEINYPISPDGKPSVKPNRVVAVGMDAAWAETENKLEYYNSVKMKCAVIIGVVQMLVGLFLSLNNYIYKGDWARVVFRFIPELVFLTCTFGYMSLLIIIKWCSTWNDPGVAPSLLEVMTNFFLAPGSVDHPLFEFQAQLQVILLLVAFGMVPVLLCGMPIYEYRRYKTWLKLKNAQDAALSGGIRVVNVTGESNFNTRTQENQLESLYSVEEMREFEHFDLSELIIHYVIHTIEYVLSTVSNTASYLRLWALSLAHAQLSEVFFTFAVVKLLGAGSPIGIGLGVLAWLGVTFAVLVGMEALSSFLHALRLHWVEFQNKFYLGDGVALEPFDLRKNM